MFITKNNLFILSYLSSYGTQMYFFKIRKTTDQESDM